MDLSVKKEHTPQQGVFFFSVNLLHLRKIQAEELPDEIRRRQHRQHSRNDHRGRVPHGTLKQGGDDLAAEIVDGVEEDAEPDVAGLEKYHRAHGANEEGVADLQDDASDPRTGKQVDQMNGTEDGGGEHEADEQPPCGWCGASRPA